MEEKNGGRGRRDAVECECLATENGFGEKECENAIRPDAAAAGASPPPPPLPLPLLVQRTPALISLVSRRRQTTFKLSSTKFTVTVTIPPFFTTKGLAWTWTEPSALTADCEVGGGEGSKEGRRRETKENVSSRSTFGDKYSHACMFTWACPDLPWRRGGRHQPGGRRNQ